MCTSLCPLCVVQGTCCGVLRMVRANFARARVTVRVEGTVEVRVKVRY